MQQNFICHFWGAFAIKTIHFDCFGVKHSQRTLGVELIISSSTYLNVLHIKNSTKMTSFDILNRFLNVFM